MAFTKVTAAGIGTTQPLELTGVNLAGVVTATGLNVTGVATFTSNVSIAGTLTYEDVTNIDSVGLITARSGISITGGDLVVGSAVTISQDNIFTTGIVTATTGSFSGTVTANAFSGDGSLLTGVASTDNIRTNTNATFLQNISVTGIGITVGDGNILAGDSFMRKHAIGIGSTNTAGRDAGIGTAVGTLIFNTDRGSGIAQVFTSSGWVDFGSNALFSASGGTKDTTSRSGYIVHTFTSPGTFDVSGPSATVEYLVVAGGGGGGTQHGGGGGAGGYRTGSLNVTAGSYTVTVGAGGNGTGGVGSPPNAPVYGSSGSNSVFGTITSTGGGRGGIYGGTTDPVRLGADGGSAGGNGSNESDASFPSVNNGNAGGFSPPEGQAGGNGRYAGGGGGGASTAGSTVAPATPYHIANGASGGNGHASSITGSPVLYAGGGGGGTHNPTAPSGQGGVGGPGGGGRGGLGNVAGGGDDSPYSGNDGPTGTAGGNDGVTNRGGGGGGGSRYQAAGGDGGSGIVIVAYPTSA